MEKIRVFKAEFFKVLSNPVRIAILDSLRDGEVSVNEISSIVKQEQSVISQHLAILRNKNLVRYRKQGSSVFYSITDKNIFKLLDDALEIAKNQLAIINNMIEDTVNS
ncbi:MAG: metalloregulator ArsR/SmtB family transcription factor [Candidatus Sericytochromatia bacterium]